MTAEPEHVPPAPGGTAVKRRRGRPRRSEPAALPLDSATRITAAAILEVLAGERSTSSAAALIGVSPVRYYVIESRAIAGLIAACAPKPSGPVPGSGEARCVDAERLNEIGRTAFRAKLKGNRKECGCYEARDMGEYDTCPHGCVYS